MDSFKQYMIKKTFHKAYGITFLNHEHPDIKRLKRELDTPSIHGDKIWDSCYLLMDYLAKNPIEEGSHVLEVGCGWGLSGIFCAKHFSAEVSAIDADASVFPYLHCHAKHNNVSIHSQQCLFNDISTQDLETVDTLIASDICFWDELADDVLNLIDRACEAGVQRIIISDPERAPFFHIAEECIEAFFAEVIPWQIKKPLIASGALLIIENA